MAQYVINYIEKELSGIRNRYKNITFNLDHYCWLKDKKEIQFIESFCPECEKSLGKGPILSLKPLYECAKDDMSPREIRSYIREYLDDMDCKHLTGRCLCSKDFYYGNSDDDDF